MRRKLKPCWALYRKGKVVNCYFAQAVAMNVVDKHLGKGLFSPRWEMPDGILTKGEYQIIPCATDYARVFITDSQSLHSEEHPTIFPSIDELVNYLKEHDLKVKKKEVFRKTFRLTTERGVLEGKVMAVL